MGDLKMYNFVTGHEYTGKNIATLLDEGFNEGDEFCTFRQALDHYKIKGKSMKGSKTVATLMTVSDDDDKEEKKKTKKPKYFRVFERSSLEAVLKSNGVGV
tara:strand:- start:688 stop:990 length:303 start_codon:yes stop_codon:yes gene_type:complete